MKYIKFFLYITLLLVITFFRFESHVAFADTAPTLNNSASGNGGTLLMTVDDGDSYLIVAVHGQDSNHANLGGSVTFNGVSLTKATDISNNNVYSALWYLKDPSPSTANISLSGSMGNKSMSASTWVNVGGDGPEATATNTGNSSTSSVSVTTLSDNAVVINSFASEASCNTIGSGETNISKQNSQSYANGENSYLVKTVAGAQSMTCSLGYGTEWTDVALSLMFEDMSSPPPPDTTIVSLDGSNYSLTDYGWDLLNSFYQTLVFIFSALLFLSTYSIGKSLVRR